MESHIKTLGILHIVMASLGILAALIIFVVMGGVAGFVGFSDHSDDSAAVGGMLGGIGVLVAGFIMLVSLPGMIGGIGLLKLAPWSRMLMIIISAINLISFPFGTALGIYGLWVLTRPEVETMLRGDNPGAMAQARTS